MASAQMLGDRRIHLRRDLLRPGINLPEIARTEEVNMQWHLLALGLLPIVGEERTGAASLEMVARIGDLLVDRRSFQDFVEVLHHDVSRRAGCVGRVVGPVLRVDAQPAPVPLFSEFLLEAKSSQENDLTPSFTQGRHAWLSEPSVFVPEIMVLQDARELLVGPFPDAFSFQREDQRLAWVVLEELQDVVVQVPEMFVACQ